MTAKKVEAKKATDFLTEDFVMNIMFQMFNGDVLTLPESEAMEVRNTFKVVLDGIKNVASTFDENVRNARKVHGSDFMPGIEIRKSVERKTKESATKEITPDDMFKAK